jgi:DNA modification methylase
MKLNKLKGNPNNPRIIKDDKFKKLVKSINDFPKMMALRPIVVDENFIVQGGNMRLKALQEIGFKDIPDEWVKQVADLNEDEKKQFIIKDNVGFGEWDWDDLANNWDAEQLTEWGLDIPNFEAEVLEAEEDNYSIPDKIKTDIVLGDLFEIGEHRLLCGDSTDSDQVAKLMNGKKADMVFTDPPYNVNYEGGSKKRELIANDKLNDFYKFLYDVYTNCFLVMHEGSPIYVAHSELERINFTLAFIDAGFKYSSVIIWVKNNSTFSMNKDYKWKHEPIIYGWKQGKTRTWNTGNIEDTIWNIDRPSKSEEHPTMKPIELCEKAIKNSSFENSLVLDLFLGSGSTMVASHQLNRKCYGMELSPEYCQVIVDRMLKLDPSLIVKRNGKPYEATH